MTSSQSQEACYEESMIDDIIVIPANVISLMVVFYLITKVICYSRKNANIHRNVKLLFFCFATASVLLSSAFIIATIVCIQSPINANPRISRINFIFIAPCYVIMSLSILCNLLVRLHVTFGNSAYALSSTQERIFLAVVAIELLLGLWLTVLSWVHWIDGSWDAKDWTAVYFWVSTIVYWIIYYVTCVAAMYKWTHKIFTVTESITSSVNAYPDGENSPQLTAPQA